MRKVLIAIVFLGFCFHIGAQGYMSRAAAGTFPSVLQKGAYGDTITSIIDGTTGIQAISIPNLGPVLGTGVVSLNSGAKFLKRSDKIAVCFPTISSTTEVRIKEVLIPFFDVKVIGTADKIKVQVYTLKADTTPGTSISSAAEITTSSIIAGGYTSVALGQCENIAGKKIMVVIEWGFNGNDTLGILSTNPANGDGKKQMKTRMYVNDSLSLASMPTGWQAVYNVFTKPYNFDADAAITLVVEGLTGINTLLSANGLSILSRPVTIDNKIATIPYVLEKPEAMSITVFDLSGTTVLRSSLDHDRAGEHSYAVDFSNFAYGSYYYTIATASALLTGKIVYLK